MLEFSCLHLGSLYPRILDFQTNTTHAVQLREMFMVIIRVKVSELQVSYVKYEHIQGYNDDNLLSDFFIFCSHSFLIAGN